MQSITIKTSVGPRIAVSLKANAGPSQRALPAPIPPALPEPTAS